MVITAFSVTLLLAVLALVVTFRQLRDERRRVREATERLGVTARELEGLDSVHALERAIDLQVQRESDLALTAHRLEQALLGFSAGAVVAGPDGRVLHRSLPTGTRGGTHHGYALVEAAVEELLAAALEGREAAKEVEWFGPPRHIYTVSALPLRAEGGELIGAAALIENLSEVRALEEMRRDFVANTSHELKTPVGAVSLLAETLADERDPEVVASLGERLRLEATRLSTIIDDLLELSRIEHEEVAVREPVAVDGAVVEALERVRAAAELRSVNLEFPTRSPGTTVPADPRQVSSAVFNLLDNAVKHSDDGATITVEVTTSDGNVEISVADDGPGIPRDDLDRIFERFYRVDRSRARATGGSGLGLSIVRHIMTNHGGSVLVSSREGEGSTFRLLFPGGESAHLGDGPVLPERTAHESGDRDRASNGDAE